MTRVTFLAIATRTGSNIKSESRDATTSLAVHHPFIGTIGILRAARNRGLIAAVIPFMEELQRRQFRGSARLMEQIRREEGGP